MTQDQIIQWAREASDPDKVPAWHNDFWTLTQEELERFAALVRSAALDEAAHICDVTPPHPFRPSIEAAHAIRALNAPA